MQEAKNHRALGARERGKIERRRRIKEAALKTFREKGYSGATTQEIAVRAGVATGTLFLYAPEKKDLLLMIVNDALDALTVSSRAAVDPNAPLLDQLVTVFAPRYEYYGLEPEISRQALHEAVVARAAERGGLEMERAEQRRAALFSAIVELVRRKQSEGSVKQTNADDIARLFHAIYVAELRTWLSIPKPELKAGIRQLRKILELAVDGVALPASRNGRSRIKA